MEVDLYLKLQDMEKKLEEIQGQIDYLTQSLLEEEPEEEETETTKIKTAMKNTKPTIKGTEE